MGLRPAATETSHSAQGRLAQSRIAQSRIALPAAMILIGIVSVQFGAGLADRLFAAMKSWIDTQRTAASGSDPTAVDALDKWVQERAQIASQTASLTRQGAASSWR